MISRSGFRTDTYKPCGAAEPRSPPRCPPGARAHRAGRVLGEHRYEVTDPVIASEAGEQGDADVHHAFGLRDHNRTPPEPRQPMPLARIVPLDAMGLVLARIELPDR